MISDRKLLNVSAFSRPGKGGTDRRGEVYIQVGGLGIEGTETIPMSVDQALLFIEMFSRAVSASLTHAEMRAAEESMREDA